MITSLNPGGGAEQSLFSMAQTIAKCHDLHVGSLTSRTGFRPVLESFDVSVHYLESRSRFAKIRELGSLITRLQPDLVHSTLIEADLISAAAVVGSNIPLVSSLVNVNHGIASTLRQGLKSPNYSAAWLAHLLAEHSAVRIHALTNHVAEVMSRRLLISRKRFDVIPRGRNPEDLGLRSSNRRSAIRNSLQIDDGTQLVIATARHEYQKGLDNLIHAFATVVKAKPSSKLLIGGRSGLETDKLQTLASDLLHPASFQFLGQRDDVADLMCAADVWCVPSRWEGFGGILVEAMALEVPVVASDIPPIREVMGEDLIFDLVPPDDPAALAAGIIRRLSSPEQNELRASMGRARFLQQFTAERVASQMLGFYERALSS